MKMRLKSGVASTLVVATVLTSLPASAHNENVHSDMVEMSYEIMLGVANKSWSLPAPSGVSPVEWDNFLKSISSAVTTYRSQPTALATPVVNTCVIPLDNNGTIDPGLNWSTGRMDQVSHPVDAFYNHTNFMCGVRDGWTPGGMFNGVNTTTQVNGHRDHTGTVLGFWAASVDNELDDTHVWVRPTNVAGVSAVKSLVNDATNFGIAALLAPLVCLFEAIGGHPESCWQDAKDAGKTINVVDDVEGLLPGFGNITGGMWTGFWHHIKVTGSASNDFDDHQGLLVEEAGPLPVPDPLDVATMIGLDIGGLSLRYEDSNGPKRYTVQQSNDGGSNSTVRSQGEWQYGTMAHTAFEPVDNLGYFGWKKFETEKTVNFLAWPLHAIGDATVPQHVAASSAWGHRPFEDAQERIWPKLALHVDPAGLQSKMVMDVLTKAFEWRKKVIAFRALHAADQPKGIPVRDIITSLAQNTAQYSMAQMPAKGWPYNAAASTTYLADEDFATRIYADRPDAADLYRPVLVDGLGATLMFLTSAAEVLQ